MAATRTQLEDKIADDLARDDLTVQITDAVNTAIRAYEEERFYFNEAYSVSATLSSSVCFIAQSVLPTRFAKLDRVRVVRSATFFDEIYKRDYDWIMAQQDIVTRGAPYEYCIYNEKLQFDNYADINYTLVLDGIKSLGNTASDSYSVASAVAWFNEARELIRHRAKREIYMHVLKDANLAAMAKLAEQEAFATLKGKTNARVSTGMIRASDF